MGTFGVLLVHNSTIYKPITLVTPFFDILMQNFIL